MYRHYQADGREVYKRWAEVIPGKPRPVEGIFIGWRTIQNGKSEWLGYDEGQIWIPDEYIECWLIVVDPRQNPIRVFPEDCGFSDDTGVSCFG